MNADQNPLIPAMVAAMAEGLRLLAAKLNRLPTDDEADMLWAAIQRGHHVPEHLIEPASMRRQ